MLQKCAEHLLSHLLKEMWENEETTLPGVAQNENAVAHCIMGKAGLLIAVLIQGKNN